MLLAVFFTLGVIYVLLSAAVNSIRHALLVFAILPVGVTGGILALFLRGMRFSPPAAIGFIAILVLTLSYSVVMVLSMDRARQQETNVRNAVFTGATSCLRLIFLTAIVLTSAFVLMAFASGNGAETQRPLATVVIGGVISSTLTILLLLPTLYRWVESRSRQLQP